MIPYRGTIAFGAGLLAALAAGWVVFPQALYTRQAQPVRFSHRAHTGKGGMQCEDCHALADDGRFTGIPRLEKCATCHAAPLGSTPEEKRFIDEYVTPGREVAWLVQARQPMNAYFPHAAHLRLGKLACRTCHGAVGQSDGPPPYRQDRISGYSRPMEMSACEDCHRRQGRRDACLDCHK